VHEASVIQTLLERADAGVLNADGQAVPWPIYGAGDKGYRAQWLDEYLLERGITPVIPSKENEDRAARLVPFEKEVYRQRNIVERLIGWLKESRRLLTRFEKTAKNFGGMIKVAFIRCYLNWVF